MDLLSNTMTLGRNCGLAGLTDHTPLLFPPNIILLLLAFSFFSFYCFICTIVFCLYSPHHTILFCFS